MKKILFSISLLIAMGFMSLSFIGKNNTKPVSADYTYEHAGTEDDPFTVTEALQKCEEVGTTAQGPFVVEGLISSITQVNTSFGNATYYISIDGTRQEELEIYRGKYLNGDAFTEENKGELEVGKSVKVSGELVNYHGNTLEFTTGSKILSIETPVYGDVEMENLGGLSKTKNVGLNTTFFPISLPSTMSFYVTIATITSSRPEVATTSIDWSNRNIQITVNGVGSTAILFRGQAHSATAPVHYYRVILNVFRNATLESLFGEIGPSLNPDEIYSERVYFTGEIRYTSHNYAVVGLGDSNNKSSGVIDAYFGSSNEALLNEALSSISPYCCGAKMCVVAQVKKTSEGQVQLLYPTIEECAFPTTTKMDLRLFGLQFLDETYASCTSYAGGYLPDYSASYEENMESIKQNFNSIFYLFFNSVYYTNLTDAMRNSLLITDANPSGSPVEQAMSTYDYIVAKYGCDNPLGREVVQYRVINYTSYTEDSTSAIFVISIITLISISTIAMLIIIKKRRGIK